MKRNKDRIRDICKTELTNTGILAGVGPQKEKRQRKDLRKYLKR